MKRTVQAVVIGAALLAAGVGLASDMLTVTKNDMTPNGLPSFGSKVNSNFTMLASGVVTGSQERLALCVTNASVAAQTATKSGTVTPQTATVTVTLTPQTCLVTNAAGEEVSVWTNCTASFTGLTNVTVSVAGVTTNVATTLQR